MASPQDSQPQIYQAENGALEIKIDRSQDTVWLTQAQIAVLFGKDRTVITKHINSILRDNEVDKKSNVQKMHFTHSAKPIVLYSLDIILAVGYRTNSARAISFRQWASSILKNYLLEGYALNQKLLEQKSEQIDEIRQTLGFLISSRQALKGEDRFLEVLEKYTRSLVILNQYDEGRLEIQKGLAGVKIETAELRQLIEKTKLNLIQRQEATNLFGQEYEGKFESTIGAVYQTFGGQDLYNSVEEKAANLLYLVIKNHAFADGNKRIGSIFVCLLPVAEQFSKKS